MRRLAGAYAGRVEIANERTHRVLAYLAAVTARGEVVVPSEALDAYAAAPDHLAGRVDLMASYSLRLTALTMGTVAEETFSDYLDRLGWIIGGRSGCIITPLGEAVLRALNAPRLDDNRDAIEIVLDPEDAFAYTRALGELADLPGTMIVDPYFRLPQLTDVVDLGTVTRVLTTKKIGKADVKRLAFGLRALGESQPIGIRFTQDLHDRYLIPADGRLRGLGTSLHSVGRSLTLLTTLGADSSQALREFYEQKWSAAEVLEPAPAAEVLTDAAEEGLPASLQPPKSRDRRSRPKGKPPQNAAAPG